MTKMEKLFLAYFLITFFSVAGCLYFDEQPKEDDMNPAVVIDPVVLPEEEDLKEIEEPKKKDDIEPFPSPTPPVPEPAPVEEKQDLPRENEEKKVKCTEENAHECDENKLLQKIKDFVKDFKKEKK